MELSNNPTTLGSPFSFGTKIVVNDMFCIKDEWRQYKFPKSKKSRIRKKWAKRSINWRMEKVHLSIKYGDTLYVSRKIRDQLFNP